MPDGRAFARVRGASSRAPELEPGRPRRAPCAKALAFRMDGVRGRRTSGERVVWSRRRALGFDRAAHARVRVSFGSVPAHRGGDGEASPGAWFRCERRASRVVRETHRRGRDGCGCDSCASRFRGSRDRGLRTVPSFNEFHGDARFFSVVILARPPRSVWSHDRSNAKAVAGDDRKTNEKTVKPTNGFSRTSLKGKRRRLKGKAAADREKGN